jgi:fructose-1,6-bisphosphatase
MSSDLVSFDGSEFAAIPPADDYMDDDQLQEYLDQLAKEEDRKSRERESLKNELFAASAVNARERETLKELLRQLDCGAGASNAEGDYDVYLDRLVEEQMQAEEQCMSRVARRVSDMSI